MSDYVIELEPDEWKEKLPGIHENDLWEILKFLRDQDVIIWDKELFEDYETLAVGPADRDVDE